MPSARRPGRPRSSARTELCNAAAESFPPKDGGRGPRRLRPSSPPSVAGSHQDSGSTSSSPFDAYSNSDSEVGSVSEYNAHGDSEDEVPVRSGSDTELDSEGEEIMKDITELDAEGPAKPRHSNRTVALWKREAEFWEQYCLKIAKKTKNSPEAQLLACRPGTLKAYLRWRKKRSRITKTSSIMAYWKRLSMYYRNVAGHRMDADTLDDICNWIYTLDLDNSEKEKLAMSVQDLYPVLHALMVDDKKALHGFVRIVILLLLILSAATATRPGAIVALKFKDVELMKVRSAGNTDGATIIANMNLEEVKNKDSSGKPKKFTFRLEALPCFCIVMLFLALGFFHDAFRYGFKDVQEIFDLRLESRDVLKLKWKDELLNRPIFCNFKQASTSIHLLKDEIFPYAKYRDIFVRLGRVAGFEYPLELYQLRRASGRNINLACDPVERNQTMGHSGDVFEKYYTPTHIARDFQSIYFGSPSEDLLIQSVARMGLSRDRRAPTELNDDQLEEVRNDSLLRGLRKERDLYKNQLRDAGYCPVATGKGTMFYERYELTKRKIGSTYQRLHKQRLNMAIREFHDSIDTIDIAKQLSGQAAEDVLTLPAYEFELKERAAVANMLFKPVQTDGMRVQFVRDLIRLCRKQETRRPNASKRKKSEWIACIDGASSKRNKCGSILDGVVRDTDPLRHITTVEIQSLSDFPIVLPHPVCLICIGNEELSYERRLRHVPRKDVLKRHVKVHFKEPQYDSEFECRHPSCNEMLHGTGHFMRHALDKHGVCH